MLGWSMIPAGLLGLFAGDAIDQIGDAWWVLGIAYCSTTILLVVADRMARRARPADGNRRHQLIYIKVTWRAATTVGLLQACASSLV